MAIEQWIAIGIVALIAIGVVVLFFRAPDEKRGWHNDGDDWPGPQ